MTIKRVYQVQTNDPVEINGILNQMMERLDDIESSSGGTSTTSTTTNTTTTNASDLIYIRDEKASGTNGGTASAGVWHTRDLNTIVEDDDSYASLSSNRFTLPAGTYRIRATAPTWRTSENRLAVYNFTNSDYELVGVSLYVNATYGGGIPMVQGVISPTEQTTYEIRHYCGDGKADTGLGYPSSTGEVEVYCEVWIEKVA